MVQRPLPEQFQADRAELAEVGHPYASLPPLQALYSPTLRNSVGTLRLRELKNIQGANLSRQAHAARSTTVRWHSPQDRYSRGTFDLTARYSRPSKIRIA